eukprot:CAMPEP_0181331830 /NCGR_PEP_ID=MMETSP1101-20121128/24737_1 /TAXON_ID=46948 /ORGANISM="Rhodomonas abbreviata, Strain Caron Lab Isolate" /LENGTH=61 /DNA_ID=CAMNT_0023441369 /DNA_START=231 /DNA_END=416 /DNA_ORIENTATION=-
MTSPTSCRRAGGAGDGGGPRGEGGMLPAAGGGAGWSAGGGDGVRTKAKNSRSCAGLQKSDG